MRRLITALLLAVSVGPTWASVDAELNNMFVDMSNFTAPGVWNSQRRGVISGGGFVARNRIANINLMSIVPPSFEAGCGGINVYGGSFSFINKEQFVGLMRNIASNAMGYAFQLALNSMCESCMQTIETLARKVQQMNQNMGNSCQMAQGIVNDTLSGMSVKGKTDASLLATLKGFAITWSRQRRTIPRARRRPKPRKTSRQPTQQNSSRATWSGGNSGITAPRRGLRAATRACLRRS